MVSLFKTKFSCPSPDSAATGRRSVVLVEGIKMTMDAELKGLVMQVQEEAKATYIRLLHTFLFADIVTKKFICIFLQMCLKCADLSALTFSPQVHRQWAARLGEEFFRQGDWERTLGLPVSPLTSDGPIEKRNPTVPARVFQRCGYPHVHGLHNCVSGSKAVAQGGSE